MKVGMFTHTVLMDYTINTKVNHGDVCQAPPAVLASQSSVLCTCVACVLWCTMRYLWATSNRHLLLRLFGLLSLGCRGGNRGRGGLGSGDGGLGVGGVGLGHC